MATAYRVLAPCVLAKDEQGKVRHYYPADSRAGDSIIPWLSDDQAAYFMELGFVEPFEVQDEADAAEPDTAQRVTQCIEALTSLGVSTDCGAPTARDALRESGAKFGNDIIASAIKARKAALSGTGA